MPRVLIVEDEMLIALALELLLQSAGYEVRSVANGRQALACLDEFSPDVVLTDYMMPGMDGLAFVAELRKREGPSRIPVVLTTAVPEQSLGDGAIDYDVYLPKPYSDATILSVLRRILDRGREDA